MSESYLESVIRQFEYYKLLGEKTFLQLRDEQLFWQYNAESNSVASIVKHLWGNMMSRWTNFLTEDGEKPWRDREGEFMNDRTTRAEMMRQWDEGWSVLLDTLRALKPEDLDRIVYIRNQGHTVVEAINRQLAHYPYHVGQIVYLGKMAAESWSSLSIPRGASEQFNKEKFSQPPRREHFTDEYLQKTNEEGSGDRTEDAAHLFAQAWIRAFNAHDTDAILEHYADDIEFYSPFIKKLDFNKEGVIRNKSELKQYFEKGLAAYPELKFSLHNIFTGVGTVTVYYTSVNGLLAAETFWLNDQGRATRVICQYSAEASQY